jgi:hypothetical protein
MVARVMVLTLGRDDSSKTPAVVWFRRDLRLSDHPALAKACRRHDCVVPLFVWDPALIVPPDQPASSSSPDASSAFEIPSAGSSSSAEAGQPPR